MGEKIRLNLGTERHKAQDVAIVAYLKQLEGVSIMVLHNHQFNTMSGEKKGLRLPRQHKSPRKNAYVCTQIKIASPV